MKMPTIDGIFIWISKANFMLSWVEHVKCFITSGSGHLIYYLYCMQLNEYSVLLGKLSFKVQLEGSW